MKATSAALRPFSAFRAGEWRSWLGIPFRPRQALEVRGGTGKMDDAALGGDVEIDQDVAAEDEIHAFHEEHFAVVVKIETGEADAAADVVVDAKLVVFGRREIFALVE